MARRSTPSLYGRVHGFAEKALDLLWRSPWLERAGRALVSSLFGRSLRRLRSHPSVAQVLIRGSYVEERFRPLLSDIDIVVWLRGAPGLPFDQLVSFLECFRAARRFDPSLRDEWQFLIGEMEWPLLEHHGGLLEMDRWCDEGGRRPYHRVPRPPPRLQLAHDWRRHDQWVETAIRFGLPAQHRSPDGVRFAACEKKASVLAARLLDREGPSRRRPVPRSREEFRGRAATLLALRDECASKVLAELGNPPLPRLPAVAKQPADAAILSVGAAVAETFPVQAILWQADVACFVTTETLDESEWGALLRCIDECGAGLPKRAVPHAQRAFSLGAPLLPRRTVAIVPEDGAGPEESMEPLLLREQLLSEALFAGAELRVMADRPAPAVGIPMVTDKLACLVTYFELGVFLPQGGGALELLLDEGRVAGIPPPGSTPERWYDLNCVLFSAVVEALSEEFSVPPEGLLDSELGLRE